MTPDLTGVQNHLCAPPWWSTNSTNHKPAEKAPVFPRISAIFFITYPFNCFHCRCYAKTTESFILQWETTHFLMLTYPFWHPKTEVRSRLHCAVRPYWGPKSPLCGPSGVQQIVQIIEPAAKSPISSKDFGNLFHHLSLQLLSLSMLCKNNGIIHFTIGNYTLFDAHLPFLTPQKRRSGRGSFAPRDLTGVQNHICAAPLVLSK